MTNNRNIIRRIVLGVIILVLCFVDTILPSSAGSDIWTSTGILGAEVWAIAVNPNDAQDVLVGISGASGAQVYRSTNGGNSWSLCNSGLPQIPYSVYDIAYDLIDTNKVYIATFAGMYKSLDGGNSWQPTTFVDPAFSLDIDPADGNIIYVGGDVYNSGIWKSIDGGNSWTAILNGVTDRVIVKVAPSAPHVLYAAHGGGLFRSTDSGQTWERADGGFVTPPRATALAIDPFSSNTVCMGSNSALYKTANGGDSWIPISAGLGSTDIRTIVIDSGNQEILYVGTASGGGTPGVYRSTDSSGTNWIPMNAGMGSVPILSLAIDSAHPQSIYAGSTASGVWKYTFVSSGPADYSISINDGALFTNQTAVTLTLTAPSGTDQMIVSNDGGFGGASWEPLAAQKPWTITSFGSYVIPRIVYAKFRTHGQISGLYQDDIILDVTSPTGTVHITGTLSDLAFQHSQMWDATTDTLTHTVYLPSITKNHRPGFRLVRLELSATDDVSGVGSMLISNDATFAGAQWQAYATRLDWWVYERGTTTVYVRFRDRAGNESQVYSETTAAP